MGAEADCTEAIYNLGVVSKRLGDHARALGLFEKLHAILPSSIEVRQSVRQSASQSLPHSYQGAYGPHSHPTLVFFQVLLRASLHLQSRCIFFFLLEGRRTSGWSSAPFTASPIFLLAQILKRADLGDEPEHPAGSCDPTRRGRTPLPFP